MFKIKKERHRISSMKERRIKNKRVQRIDSMRIPPAWNKVVVSKNPNSKFKQLVLMRKDDLNSFIHKNMNKIK